MFGTYNEKHYDRYYDEERSTVSAWLQYGNGEGPRHLNTQWEVGGSARLDRILLSFTYSRGLTNHHFYTGYSTRQNKLAFSFAVMLGKDE